MKLKKGQGQKGIQGKTQAQGQGQALQEVFLGFGPPGDYGVPGQDKHQQGGKQASEENQDPGFQGDPLSVGFGGIMDEKRWPVEEKVAGRH